MDKSSHLFESIKHQIMKKRKVYAFKTAIELMYSDKKDMIMNLRDETVK